MHLILEQLACTGEARLAQRFHLGPPVSLGAGARDAITVPSLPPQSCLLSRSAGGVIADIRATGWQAAGRPVAQGQRWLVRSGEALEWPGWRLSLEPPAGVPEGTLAAASQLWGQLRNLSPRDLADNSSGGGWLIPSDRPHLVVLTGPHAGNRILITAEGITLGRSSSSTLPLPDQETSRFHARIELEGGCCTVQDLGSKNGVLLNGVSIGISRRSLHHGDELLLGSTWFAFEDLAAALREPGLALPKTAASELIPVEGTPNLTRTNSGHNQRAGGALLLSAGILLTAAALIFGT